MRSAAQTYKNVARQTASPRELEAILLLQAAARLQTVHDAWDQNAGPARRRAALQSQALVGLSQRVTDGNNPMPSDVRQNVANLGLFVMNHTVAVMSDPRPEQLDSLININRELAAGLLARA